MALFSPRRDVIALIPAAAVCVALVAGCGGNDTHHALPDTMVAASSPSPGQLDAGFRARAEAVCQGEIAAYRQHPFPDRSFDPYHPHARELPELAAYLTRTALVPDLRSGLAALGDPPSDPAGWQRLLTQLHTLDAKGRREIVMARRSDVDGFVAAARSTDVTLAAYLRDLWSAGFATISPCQQLFTGRA